MQVPLPSSQVISSVWWCSCCYCSYDSNSDTNKLQGRTFHVLLPKKGISEELGNPDLGKLNSPSRSSGVADRIQQLT